jgi:DNA polymerase-3 subunit delta
MKLNPENLPAHLARELAPVYLVAGDETLLVDEAADAIRAAARAAGVTEREVHFIERGVDWSQIRGSAGSMSLFGERRLLELRLASGKLGKDGGAAVAELCETASPESMLLILAPRLERDTLSSAWVRAVEARGAHLTAWPIESARLPRWLAQRSALLGLEPTPDALALLAQRVEGNLLAAHQELEKLRLAPGAPRITAEDVMRSVADSARYDVFRLGEAALAGDAARALRVLEGLRAEGVEPTLALWALTRELRSLWAARESGGAGEGGGFGARMPPARQAAWSQAMRRLRGFAFGRLAARALRVDRMVKGRLDGDPWGELRLLTAEFCGAQPLHAATLRLTA